MKNFYSAILLVSTACCLSCTASKEPGQTTAPEGNNEKRGTAPNDLSQSSAKSTNPGNNRPVKNLVITYDFATKTMDMPPQGYRVKYGGTPRIVVTNVNTSQYGLKVDEEQLFYAYESAAGGTDATNGDNEKGAGAGSSITPFTFNRGSTKDSVSTAQLVSKSKELIALLNYYRHAPINYLTNGYKALVDSRKMPYGEVAAQKEALDRVYEPVRNSLLANYNSLVEGYFYLLPQLKERQGSNQEVKLIGDSLAATFKAFEQLDLLDKFGELDRLRALLSEGNFTATYNASAVKADEVLYLLTIESNDTLPSSRQQTKVPIPVRVAGNWKIDVSSGVMFNIGVQDRSFRLDPVNEDSLVLRKDKQRSAFSPTVGIMTHVYKKSAGYVNWGISFGLGINDEQRLRYYGGLGLMVGEKQRFVVSGGLTAAPRNVLKGSFRESQRFAVTAAPETLTEGVYRIGAFVSLTYNLTSNTVKAAKSGE